ncbi:hypothetical protein PMKS-000838 [Pichia membranifaciens]|uniref:mRNA-capping enzyme subunit beta n=1 Tax=Pichia membranifaciens TaxID=4926 RepID=A0A1Q2YDA8_9ASCO|nr:hypothetical protein PMKS-000838 [Pichia membranifaciens]
MDLKNLISRTSDDESSAPNGPQVQLSKRTSQPRLSIHSLMNDNDNEKNNVNNKEIDKENKADAKEESTVLNGSQSKKKEALNSGQPIPKPTGSTSDYEVPTMEQKAAPFLPSDETGINVDLIERGEQERMREEPSFRTTNTTEAQEEDNSKEDSEANSRDDSARIKSRSSISALTNDSNIEVVAQKPPLPDTKPPKQENEVISGPPSTNDIIGTEDKKAIKEMDSKNQNNPSEKSIHEQIQKLEDLKKKEEIEVVADGKPKRYKNKPTWAQDYIPSFNQPASGGANGLNSFKGEVSLNNISKLSVPSITGSIPRNDFNKLVTEWIWANVEGVKQDYLDIPNVEEYIEIESKLGNIWDKVKDRRIQLPVNTECVVATDYVNQECFFKPGITLENYNDTKSFISKLIQEAAEQQQQGKGDPSNKFIIENSHVVDLIASDSRRGDKPISGRVSLDIKTKRKTNSISKQRISDLYLHFPNTLFDVRMSLSVELPKELNDAAFEIFKKRVTMEREKERVSYIHQATSTRIDLTKVREKNNRIPKYELELEINTPALLRSMRNVMEDPLYYMDLVQAFLDNSKIITRHLSHQRQ